MDAAKGCLPQALSLAHRVPGPSLASRRAGRRLDRDEARDLLSWLLLAVNGVAVRRRADGPRLGCGDRNLGAAGKDDPMGRTVKPADGCTVHRMGFCQLNQSGLRCITADAGKGDPSRQGPNDRGGRRRTPLSVADVAGDYRPPVRADLDRSARLAGTLGVRAGSET